LAAAAAELFEQQNHPRLEGLSPKKNQSPVKSAIMELIRYNAPVQKNNVLEGGDND
jgi:hypothetical protein